MRPGLLAATAALCLCAQVPTIPASEFAERRAKLRKNLDGALVLFGWNESPDEVYRTVQQSSFLYLTGFEEPGAILLLTAEIETLFVPERNERKERYNGKRVAPGDPDLLQRTGFSDVAGVGKFESRLSKALETAGPVYALLHDPQTPKLRALVPFREVKEASPLVAKLRMSKSPAELAAIRYATGVSMRAHLSSWKKVHPGSYEYQALSSFTQVLTDAGCERHSYEPIFGSGPNSVVLHYNANRRKMDSGEVIVIDAAASCGGYASDITRSLPVNGKFTERQRQVYEVVLGSQKAALASLKPGVTLAQLTAVAKKYMDEHGGFAKYFAHGIGHHVGLDVHDLALNEPLQAGAVVTLEPGIYIPEENLGIRIEDVVVVTRDGAQVLSGALPKEASEIEKAMAR